MLDHLIRKIGRKQAIEALIKIAYPDIDFTLTEQSISAWIESQGIAPSAYFGYGRMRIYTGRRYIVWYYLHDLGMSLNEIGQMFGGRDHSTIHNGIDKHKGWTEMNDKAHKEIIQSFEAWFVKNNSVDSQQVTEKV